MGRGWGVVFTQSSDPEDATEASGVDTAAQGTVRWFVPDQGSIEELAYEVRQSEGTDTETGPIEQ